MFEKSLLVCAGRTTAVFAASALWICSAASPAHADKGGVPNAHAASGAPGAAAAGTQGAIMSALHSQGGERAGLIIGVTPVASGATTYLQFTNAGTQAGTATVTLYAASTGTQLGTWTSPSIPANGSLLQDVAAIASGATPALTSAQAAAAVDLSVQSTIHGSVQTLMSVSGAVTNISACGSGEHAAIGGVPGPGNASMAAVVRIGNNGGAASHATLTLYNSADGTKLGTWTSSDVPAHGSLTITTTALAAAATPVVPATATSFTIAVDPTGLDAQVLEQAKTGGALTLLNNACQLKGSGAAAHDASDDSEDDSGDAADAPS